MRDSRHHESLRTFRRTKEATDRAFGFVMAAFFLLLALWPALKGQHPRGWALALAIAFLAAGLVKPRALAPLNRAWLRLGYLLQAFASPLVMLALYSCLFVPMGLALRALGKDLLRTRARRAGNDSYWIKRSPAEPWPGDMRRQF